MVLVVNARSLDSAESCTGVVVKSTRPKYGFIKPDQLPYKLYFRKRGGEQGRGSFQRQL